VGCSSGGTGGTDAGNPADSASAEDASDGALSSHDAGESDGGDASDAPVYVYTLIDNMETTTHGPIELAGIKPPESPGYWFNFVSTTLDGSVAHGDTIAPPYRGFVFTALPTPTPTLDGKLSKHAAYELCGLNGQYDVCGVGFEFAQVPIVADGGDAGGSVDATILDASGKDAGEAGVPMVTVPFDISRYEGIVFWGRTTAGDDAGTLAVKVLFPDTDTDPRGGVCNGAAAGASGPNDTSQCYNDYGEQLTFTGNWQEFTVPFADLKIDKTFGFQGPGPFVIGVDGGVAAEAGAKAGEQSVYGINWQGQDNNVPDSGTLTVNFWVADVYFISRP
jgi:hypothetical protein